MPTPGPSHSHGPPNTATALHSLRPPAFQGRQRSPPSTDNSLRRGSQAVPQNNKTTSKPPASVPEVAQTSSLSKLPASDEEYMISSKPKAEPPIWSVEYHPEAKPVLDLHLANVITYETSIYCLKVSPDGYRVAIGLKDGTTYLNELRTGLNIWLVSERLVRVSRFELT